MAPNNQDYVVEDEMVAFFSKSSVRRETCDLLAKELVGGDQVAPVAVQGACSYTVYAGHDLDHVVQFRLKSLGIKLETAALARRIFGSLVPEVSFRQQLGQDSTTVEAREPLLVYVMNRMRGITRLDFVLSISISAVNHANPVPNTRFFAQSWKSPQEVDQARRLSMLAMFERELHLLLAALPGFDEIIRATLASLPNVLSLPMVLVHKDFGDSNIMVQRESSRLVGVIDWAEAEVAPFGTNLHSLQSLISKLHLKHGWIHYEDYGDLMHSFWENFDGKVGGLSHETTRAIKAARVL
ncbi:hypothetical protein CSHISOI_11656, partial [Colletotrichum shisoi]